MGLALLVLPLELRWSVVPTLWCVVRNAALVGMVGQAVLPSGPLPRRAVWEEKGHGGIPVPFWAASGRWAVRMVGACSCSGLVVVVGWRA